MGSSDIENKITEVAGQPKTYENDGEKITNHSLPELIEADRHLAKKRAGRNPFAILHIAKISTQGPQK